MPFQETNCKECNIKIVDTSWKPEKLHDLCTECEQKQNNNINQLVNESLAHAAQKENHNGEPTTSTTR